ncbi:MAG: aromatic ring-hydroxylating dioxygenase subunit alpha, partial [Caulobacterales bacterium]
MGGLELPRLKADMEVEARRTAPNEGLPAFPDIPAARYTDPAFFDLELGAFRKSWVYALHGTELPERGSYMKWERLGEPLFFTRGQDGKVRCFYNICRHRANPVVHEEKGHARTMTCKVHGWSYGLDGRLLNLRDRRDFRDLDTDCRSLVEVRCESLGSLYFINISGDAPPLVEWMGQTGEEWSRFRPDQSHLIRRTHIVVKANWKIVQEANMEVSHVTLVHPEIVDKYLDYEATVISHYKNGHTIQATRTQVNKWTESDVPLPSVDSVADLVGVANFALNLFPNIVAPLNSWGYPLQTYWPIDLETTLVENHYIGHAPETPETAPIWNEIIDTFHRVLYQD